MTILAGVLALAPTLCWELADSTGPAASDASGNGHAGVYGGSAFILGQPGPEASTKCALFTGSGGVNTLTASPVGVTPWTMMSWLAARSLVTASAIITTQGRSGAHGEALAWATGGLTSSGVEVVQQGIRVLPLAYTLLDGGWHQLVLTHDGADTVTLYADGLTVDVRTGLTVNTPVATPFGAGPLVGADTVFQYCVALWGRALSSTEVSTAFAAHTALQQPANLLTVSGADLDAILAAVRRTY